MAARLQPGLASTRKRLTEEKRVTRAKLHIPVPVYLRDRLGMGGRPWMKQVAEDLPTVGKSAEPGDCPTQPIFMRPILCEELLKDGSLRCLLRNDTVGPNDPVREESTAQTVNG